MKIRTKMSRQQRAKQFAPFRAVGGLELALARKEEEHRRGYEEVVLISVEESELNELEASKKSKETEAK